MVTYEVTHALQCLLAEVLQNDHWLLQTGPFTIQSNEPLSERWEFVVQLIWLLPYDTIIVMIGNQFLLYQSHSLTLFSIHPPSLPSSSLITLSLLTFLPALWRYCLATSSRSLCFLVGLSSFLRLPSSSATTFSNARYTSERPRLPESIPQRSTGEG